MNRLVILTKNYGYNFTGATLATQKLVEQWCNYFTKIMVYTLHVGKVYANEKIDVQEFSSLLRLFIYAHQVEKVEADTVYYSDDHFGFLFRLMGKDYFHTYHGNWPDIARLNWEYRIKSVYFMPLYYLTIKYARAVINVSFYMKKFTDKINLNSKIIHNGMDFKPVENVSHRVNTCLMVGNIDKRKYQYAIAVARELEQRKSQVNIDIYGKEIDMDIVRDLERAPNIELKGMVRNVPYTSYDLFLNLSSMENLSISVCEAIKNRVPVVCFDVGGLSEVVIPERTGITIEPFDISKITREIEKMLECKMRVDDSVLKSFCWDKSGLEYVQTFLKQ